MVDSHTKNLALLLEVIQFKEKLLIRTYEKMNQFDQTSTSYIVYSKMAEELKNEIKSLQAEYAELIKGDH